MAHRETNVGGSAGIDEAVGERGRVGSGGDLDDFRVDGQLGQRHGQQLDMISGGVGPGVAGTQDPRQGFVGGVQEREQRMEPEPLLVVRGRALLLRVGRHEGSVEVDHVEAGVGSRRPNLPAGLGSGRRDPLERSTVDGFQGPPRRRRRGDLAEQVGLVAEHSQIRDGVAAVGDHHREIHQHLATVVASLTLLGRRHGHRHALGQPHGIREIRQESSAHMRGDVPAIGGYHELAAGPVTLHLGSALLVGTLCS